MTAVNHRECVELFHLLFLDQLGRRVNKNQCVVKGGCNLRFFFRSIRYSQDMDLDVRDIPAHALEDKVGGILNSTPFRVPPNNPHCMTSGFAPCGSVGVCVPRKEILRRVSVISARG